MEDNEDFTKLLKQYEKIFKIFRAHMKECPSFEKKVLEEVNFDE